MTRTISTILIVLTTVVLTQAQNSTYFGFEVGPKFEVYQYSDKGGYIYTKPFFSVLVYGFTIGQEINQTFLFETGLYFVDYSESYRVKKDVPYSITNALFVFQIPFRLKARLNLVKDKLNLATTVGYSLNINSSYGTWGYGRGTFIDPQDTIVVFDSSDYKLRKTYPLLELGLALEYQFKNKLTIYLGGNFFIGLKRVINIDVSYKVNNGPDQTATVFSNGSYYNFIFGVKYPISNLWINKKKEYN